MKILRTFFIPIFAFTFMVACSKDNSAGPGGTAIIQGRVMHHDLPIPNSTVFIKFGAIEQPGTESADYDSSVKASEDASYRFDGLKKGNYFLYGIGYDSTIFQTVIGGIPITIEREGQVVQTDVPVTED